LEEKCYVEAAAEEGMGVAKTVFRKKGMIFDFSTLNEAAEKVIDCHRRSPMI